MNSSTYDYKYSKDQVICEGVVHFVFTDGSSIPVHADIFRKKTIYASPILLNIIADTQGELNSRQIPVPEFVTPMALDFYLCCLYGLDVFDHPQTWFSGSIEVCIQIAGLFRWADVDQAVYAKLDALLVNILSYTLGECSNERSFKFINDIEDFSDVMPLSYAQCLHTTMKALVSPILKPDDVGLQTYRRGGIPLLLASSESYNLSPQSWRALFFAFANAVRAPFEASNFGSRAQNPKVDERTFMVRLNEYIALDERKYRPWRFQLQQLRLTFSKEDKEEQEDKEEEEVVVVEGSSSSDHASPWMELVALSDPTVNLNETERTFLRYCLHNSSTLGFCARHNEHPYGEWKMCSIIKCVLTATILFAPEYHDTHICMVVCVRVENHGFSKRKRPSDLEPAPPDIGNISNVSVSFVHENVHFNATAAEQSITGGFLGGVPAYPDPPCASHSARNLKFLRPYFKEPSRVFPVQCTSTFLQAVSQVATKDIRINLTCEVSFD
jgi:hypothetical protein